MDNNYEQERRKQRALQRLGTANPHCVYCGQSDWRCLELHHILQKRYGDETVIMCRNCHQMLSDDQRDHPPPLTKEEPCLLERVGHFLLGLAGFFATLADWCRDYGKQLIDAARWCPPPYGIAEGGAA
jgi:hypothetical protein